MRIHCAPKARFRGDSGPFPLGLWDFRPYTAETIAPDQPVRGSSSPPPQTLASARQARREQRRPARKEGLVKQAEDASFVDLIACERDCRSCSYAAALDCDGNCGVCPHNGYCPCVNPVVARSKTALRLIELRPILLQDLQVRN